MVYTQLWYYLRTSLGIPNPSRALYRVAARIDGSVWVVPHSRIPHNLIADLIGRGGVVGTLDYAAYESDKALQLATNGLERRILQLQESLAESMNGFQQEADTNAVGKARQNYRRRCQAALSQAKRDLLAVRNAIDLFDVRSLHGTLTGALASVTARRIEMENRAKHYAAITVALGALPGANAAGLAQEAAQNTLPVGIGADYLTDNASDPAALATAAATAEVWADQV